MQVAAVAPRISIVKHGIRSVVHLLIGHLFHFKLNYARTREGERSLIAPLVLPAT